MTYIELLRNGIAELSIHQVPGAHHDAEVLLKYAAGMDNALYLLHQMEQVPGETEEAYRDFLQRRSDRIPLQQIIGSQDFMGYEIFVDENVLCPRLDTESLVEKAYEVMDVLYQRDEVSDNEKIIPIAKKQPRAHRRRQVLDLCTGSGCIAIAIKKYADEKCYPLELTAVDASEAALSLAKKSARFNGAKISFLSGDLFAPVGDAAFDLVISNPPYIPTEVIPALMPEVRDYEPHLALDGGRDGLDFYRRISKEALSHLKKDGYLMFEIGFDQGDDVKGIMTGLGYQDVEIHKDLAGNDRIAMGWRNQR